MKGVKTFSLLVGVLLFVLPQGCAPGLGKEIPVTRFPPLSALVRGVEARGPVLVKPFTDSRQTQAVVQIDGRGVAAKGDVANAVRGAVESYLRSAGYSPGAVGAPVVSGDVQVWSALVHPGFPSSRVDATATLSLAVLSPDGTEHYRGSYRGEFSVENPLLNEDKIADALGQAMGVAIQTAIQDTRFTSALSSGS